MTGAVDKERDRRARLLEVFISVLASVVSSAVVVAWTISATFSEYSTRLEEHDRRFSATQSQLEALSVRQLTQERQIATSDAHYVDILRRLDSIDRKLEGRR